MANHVCQKMHFYWQKQLSYQGEKEQIASSYQEQQISMTYVVLILIMLMFIFEMYSVKTTLK